MRRPLLALSILAALPLPAHAQEESAERRADRLRTIELNRGAEARISERDQSNADIREANRKAQLRYERARAEWRQRVEACRAGDHAACAPQ